MNQEEIIQNIASWTRQNTEVIKIDNNTYEIATTEIDSFGNTVYCFLEEIADGYLITDDARLLFKFDPGQENESFLEMAKEMILGAGYDYDDDSGEISIMTDRANIAQAIIRLAQLQVAISFMI